MAIKSINNKICFAIFIAYHYGHKLRDLSLAFNPVV